MMAWLCTGDKPLSETMKAQFTDAYMSFGLNEFKAQWLGKLLWPLLLTWFNFNPSMDK